MQVREERVWEREEGQAGQIISSFARPPSSFLGLLSVHPMHAIIFIGIQASGKSTFYRERFADTHIRINLDMLKTRNRERILLAACIAAKQPFVVDNTNVAEDDRAKYIIPAKAAGFRIVGYYFSSKLTEAIERNKERTGTAVVPDKGIAGTYKRLQLPSHAEGFDELYYVTIDRDRGFIIEEWNDELR